MKLFYYKFNANRNKITWTNLENYLKTNYLMRKAVI